MIGLLISACNLMYDNTRNEMEKPCFVKGIGTVDGKLDLFELYSRFHMIFHVMKPVFLKHLEELSGRNQVHKM